MSLAAVRQLAMPGLLSIGIILLAVHGSYLLDDRWPILLLIPVAIGVVLVSLAKPWLIMLLLVALIPLDTLADLSENLRALTLYKVLFPLALIALLIRQLGGAHRALQPHMLDRWVFAWAGLNCLLVFNAVDTTLALDFVRRLLSMVALYYVVSRLFAEAVWYERLTTTIIVAAGVSVCFGLVSYLTGVNPFVDETHEIVRITGAANISPNVYGVILIPPLLLALARIFDPQRDAGRGNVLLAATALLLIVGISLSFSRSAFVTLVLTLGMVLLMWGHRLRGRHWLGMAIIALCGLVLIPADYWSRIDSLFESAQAKVPVDYSLWRRLNYLSVGANIFEEFPLLGSGPGNFRLLHAMADYQTEPSLIGVERLAHNIYLQSLTETGVVGLLLYLGVLVTAIITARRIARSDNMLSWQGGALFMAMMAFTVMGLFSHITTDKTFWVVLAMVRILPELDASRRRGVDPVRSG